MNFWFLYLFFLGILLTIGIFGLYRLDFLFPKKVYLFPDSKKNELSKKTLYFSVFFFIELWFVVSAAFQYISEDEAVRWMVGVNDMPRYKFAFEDASKYNYFQFFFKNAQEPLYLLYIFLMRKLTSHFSIVLFITYFFILFSIIKFISEFIDSPSIIHCLSFFCIFYNFMVTSFCLFRMGIAVAISLHFFIFLKQSKYFRAFIIAIIATGFHISAFFCFFVLFLERLYSVKHWKPSVFALLYILTLLLGFLSVNLLPKIIAIFGNRYLSYMSGELAVGTYLTNFGLVLLILLKRKCFIESRKDLILYITILASFYIMICQSFMSVFYRMIFFTYPCILMIIPKIYKIYIRRKNDMFLSFFVILFLFVVLLLKLYGFFSSWDGYGLNSYKLFFFY